MLRMPIEIAFQVVFCHQTSHIRKKMSVVDWWQRENTRFVSCQHIQIQKRWQIVHNFILEFIEEWYSRFCIFQIAK